jgi:hypothetical protein
MAMTAENLATQYNISRQDSDNFALQTQTRWQQGNYSETCELRTTSGQATSVLFYVCGQSLLILCCLFSPEGRQI